MKQSNIGAIVAVMLLATALAAFGDEYTVNLESRILETFDDTEDTKYIWKSDASRYSVGKDEEDKDNPSFAEWDLAGKGSFPRVDHKDGWPMALFRNNREKKALKILGIWSKFKRMGYNWIDIYPVLKAGGDEAPPYEIPIPGRVRYLDMWVWGSNLNYYVEAYLRDQQGIIHTIYLGNIGYTGWRNLRATVPTSIAQRRHFILSPKDDLHETESQPAPTPLDRSKVYLKFVKFRIWTTPAEQVANAYVYFDQFKVLTDTFESLYDGDELTDPDWINENWGSEK
jgi:hypothetical protein